MNAVWYRSSLARATAKVQVQVQVQVMVKTEEVTLADDWWRWRWCSSNKNEMSREKRRGNTICIFDSGWIRREVLLGPVSRDIDKECPPQRRPFSTTFWWFEFQRNYDKLWPLYLWRYVYNRSVVCNSELGSPPVHVTALELINHSAKTRVLNTTMTFTVYADSVSSNSDKPLFSVLRCPTRSPR